MVKIELYKPKNSVDKYGRIISIDQVGRQETKDPMNIGLIVDNKPTTLGTYLQTLNEEDDKLRQEIERKDNEMKNQVAMLKHEIYDEIGKQKEINKLLLQAMKEEGVI